MTTTATAGTLPESVPFLLFREKGPSGNGAVPIEEAKEQAENRTGKAILCRACRLRVTSEQQSISIQGRHLHAFFNPAGVLYEVRCFRKAPGALVHGEPTDEFSWFSDYVWQYCLCGACLEHLGWFFKRSGDSFYGLIPSKLIADEGEE